MAQAISRQRVIPESRVCAPVISLRFVLAEWHLERFLSDFFGVPLSVSFHGGAQSPCIIWRMKARPVGGRS
jgi:hypothetical protein